MKSDSFTFVDFFCGAGGFTEGILLAGGRDRRFHLALATDVHENACRTHQHRFKTQLGIDYNFLTKDIRDPTFVSALLHELGSKEIDLVVGGPPCQGFSLFGARKEDDARNDLFRPYLRAIAELKPRYFVMENVPGLALMYGGEAVRSIAKIVGKMTRPRYHLAGPIRVNATDFGVPQLRERILFIGSRYDVPVVDAIPITSGRAITAKEAIDDLSFLRAWESNGAYHESHPPVTAYQEDSRSGRLYSLTDINLSASALHNHEAARHSPEVIARFAMMEPGAGFESIPRSLWAEHLQSSKKWCVRLAPDKPAYTVTTLPDDFVHYKQHRILTVREWARLQSFDDTFVFLGPRATGGGGKGNKKRNFELPQYTQVGNAVPPLLARGIGSAILAALEIATPRGRIRRNDLLSKIH